MLMHDAFAGILAPMAVLAMTPIGCGGAQEDYQRERNVELEPDKSVVVCPRCKARPTTTMYNSRNGHIRVMVCHNCLDRLEIQDAFEWGIVEMEELEEQERYDEMLAWIDAFEEANRHRDQDNWLAMNVASHRALILWQAERYEESLAECEKREQFGFEDAWHRWAEGSAKASALEGLGRHDEALAAFEAAFRHQDARFTYSARHLMRDLVKLSANAGKPVDESWRPLIQAIAADYEVEFPVRPTLAESITALFELTENRLTRRQREEQANNP